MYPHWHFGLKINDLANLQQSIFMVVNGSEEIVIANPVFLVGATSSFCRR
jgi:hypothetical protein